MMRFDVVSLFPEMFRAVTESGITARAMKRGLWSLNLWNPRDETHDPHRTVDDRPFGGGPGMILMADPLAKTIDRCWSRWATGSTVRWSASSTLPKPKG